MTSRRLMDGLSGRPGNGPSTVVNYTGNLICGTTFYVTGEAYFEGYWWWVAPTGQSTSPVKCALWAAKTSGGGDLIPGTVVTSGTLTAGQWNFIPLATPVPLSLGTATANWAGHQGSAQYVAAIGVNGSFPETPHQFGAGNPYSAGITNGQLVAFSAPSGSNPATWGNPQCNFTTAVSDPSVVMPAGSDNDANLWVDVQVTDTMPAGIPLSLFPNLPSADASTIGNDTATSSSATEFHLSSACKLTKIRVWSPNGAVNLPQRVGIWNISGQTIVTGTDITNPTWSGAPGSGWVYVDYTSANITLPAGQYKVSAWNGLAANYYNDTEGYWGTFTPDGTGPGANGITFGPLSAPSGPNGTPAPWDNASGTKPIQDTYQLGAWAYPNTGETKSGLPTYENRWQDVEVIPLTSANVPGLAAQVTVAGPAGASSVSAAASPASVTVSALAGTASGPAVVAGLVSRVAVAALTGTPASILPGAPVDAQARMQFRAYTSVTAQATMEFEAGQPVQTGLITLAEDPWTSMYPG